MAQVSSSILLAKVVSRSTTNASNAASLGSRRTNASQAAGSLLHLVPTTLTATTASPPPELEWSSWPSMPAAKCQAIRRIVHQPQGVSPRLLHENRTLARGG